MPRTALHVQRHLQQRIVILPQDGEISTFLIVIYVLSGIVAIAALALWIAIAVEYFKLCKIETNAAGNNERALGSRTESLSTLAGHEDNFAHAKTNGLLGFCVFLCRGQKAYAKLKNNKSLKNWKRTPVKTPVTRIEIEEMTVRCVHEPDADTPNVQRNLNPTSETTLVPTAQPSLNSETALQAPPPLYRSHDTSTDYQDPALLIREIVHKLPDQGQAE
jgi:hypothetical protein